MTPVLDDQSQLANSISGGMLGEIGQVLSLLSGSARRTSSLGIAGQMVDVFGLLTSGTQMGYEDSAFFWSDMFHYRKTYQFARRLYTNALKADAMTRPTPSEPSRVPKQQAFALGWMSHCATDVAGHPFTNAKCGGPYRTHWQRHHVVENHMDALVYAASTAHPMASNYDSLDTSALHFRLAFSKSGPARPDDARRRAGSRLVPVAVRPIPAVPEGETRPRTSPTRQRHFDVDTEPLPEHICELLQRRCRTSTAGPTT